MTVKEKNAIAIFSIHGQIGRTVQRIVGAIGCCAKIGLLPGFCIHIKQILATKLDLAYRIQPIGRNCMLINHIQIGHMGDGRFVTRSDCRAPL